MPFSLRIETLGTRNLTSTFAVTTTTGTPLGY